MKFLDCTLRDGGYYNNWDFSRELISEYLYSMKEAKIDWVEIGFRSPHNIKGKGANAYSTDEFISSFKDSDGLDLAVMINASDFLSLGNIKKELNKSFASCKNSPVSLVRVACHFEEFHSSKQIFETLLDLGYKVGVNLMQIGLRKKEEIEEFSKICSKFPFEVVYFADSTGSLEPKEIQSIVKSLKKNWLGEIGCHMHDNLGNALLNSSESIKNDVTWIDSTVMGMGRGPGNLQTEYSLMDIGKDSLGNKNLIPLFDLIDKFFLKLHKKYNWGKNPFYYLAGKNKIHPTFIQEMISDKRYSNVDIIKAISFFKEAGGSKFNQELLDNNRVSLNGKPHGSWNPSEEIEDKEFLILGPGNSLEKNKKLRDFIIENKDLIIFSCNSNLSSFYLERTNYFVACHPIRILAEFSKYKDMKKKLIIPYQRQDQEMKEKFSTLEYFDFGLSLEPGKFIIGKDRASIPALNVSAYCLAIAASAKAKKIYVAGLDGFKNNNSKQEEMQEIFDAYKRDVNVEMLSLTPTSYKIPIKFIS